MTGTQTIKTNRTNGTNGTYRTYLLLLSCMVIGLLFARQAQAAEPVGRITAVEGKVELLKAGALPASPAKAGDPVFARDIVRTKSDSRAEVTFNDGNRIKIAQRSRVDISEYTADRGIIGLPRGKVEAIVDKKGPTKISTSQEGHRFEIHTATAVAGVRGTDFFVFTGMNVTGILVKEGSVYAYNPNFPKNVVTVPAGSITMVPEKSPPRTPRPATPGEMQAHEKDMPADKPKGKAEGESGEKQAKSDSKGGDGGQKGEAQGGGSDKSGGGGEKGGGTSDEGEAKLVKVAANEGGSAPVEGGSGGTMPGGMSLVQVPDFPVVGPAQRDMQPNIGPVLPPPLYIPPTDNPGLKEELIDKPLAEAQASAHYPYSTGLLGIAFTHAVISNPGYGTTVDDGLLAGDLKINTAPWGGASVPISFDGLYMPDANVNAVWSDDIFYSYNDLDSIKLGTTYDGGAFYGYVGGRQAGSKADGKLYTLYIDPNGRVGYLLGSLQGDLSATTDPSIYTLIMSGTMKSVEMEASSLLPEGLLQAAILTTEDETLGTINNFTFDGYSMNGYDYYQEKTSLNTATKWGIWYSTISGRYNAGAGYLSVGPSSTSWTWDMAYHPADYSKYIAQRTDGAQWSSNSIYGTTRAFYGDITGEPVTGIAVGETIGTFNATDLTFQAVQMGVWMETPKFLAMAADPLERAKLQQLNIPAVEVGRVSLLFQDANTNVTLNNVQFFAPAAGGKPTIWASGNVTGNWVAAPALNTAIPNVGTVGGTNASFAASTSDFTFNHMSGGKWLGTISTPGAGTGTINGYNIKIDGVAAGTYSGNSVTSGTAAGIAK